MTETEYAPIWFMDSYGAPLLIIDKDGKLTFAEGLVPKDILKIISEAFDHALSAGTKIFEFWWCPEHDKIMRPGTGRHSKTCKVENYTPLYSIKGET